MSEPTVRKRCVLYLSGFDPKGAAHYHALYRTEAARQSLVSGFQVAVGPRRKLPNGNALWSLQAQDGGGDVATDYEFLRWDDVVRQHWQKNPWRLWWDVLTTSVHYMKTGALWRMKRLSWPPFVALFAPFLLLCAVVLGVPLVAWVVWLVAIAAGGTQAMAAGCTLAWLGLALWGSSRLERRFSMFWLMRSYAFTRRQAAGETPELDQRLQQHAETLRQRVQTGGYDEVLLVAHSSGCIMAVEVMGRALQGAPQMACQGVAVNLLTLGQWIPLLATLPEARSFREHLGRLGTAKGLGWVDVSAPPDGCCFALCDPLRALQVPLEKRQPDRPKLVSPRFVKMFEPAVYEKLKQDRFRIHFQYIMAADLLTDYDYFRWTAGSRYLVDPTGDHPS